MLPLQQNLSRLYFPVSGPWRYCADSSQDVSTSYLRDRFYASEPLPDHIPRRARRHLIQCELNVPLVLSEHRLLLRCAGISGSCVLVNGESVGTVRNSLTVADTELHHHISYIDSNLITFLLYESDTEAPVFAAPRLYATPRNYIRDILTFSQPFRGGQSLSWSLDIIGEDIPAVSLYSPRGWLCDCGSGHSGVLTAVHAEFWQPESPALYELHVQCGPDSFQLPLAFRSPDLMPAESSRFSRFQKVFFRFPDEPGCDAQLDICDLKGIPVIYDFGGSQPSTDHVIAVVSRLKHHACICGWSFSDAVFCASPEFTVTKRLLHLCDPEERPCLKCDAVSHLTILRTA